MRRQDGVTLIELMIVMIIIAILSVVIFVNMGVAIDDAERAQLEKFARDLTIDFVRDVGDLVPGSQVLTPAIALANDPNLITAILEGLDANSDGVLRYDEVFAADPVALARTLAPSFGGSPTDPNVASDPAVQAAFGDYIVGAHIAEQMAGEDRPGVPLGVILADPVFLLKLLLVPLMSWPFLLLMAVAIVVSGELVLRRRAKRRKRVSV